MHAKQQQGQQKRFNGLLAACSGVHVINLHSEQEKCLQQGPRLVSDAVREPLAMRGLKCTNGAFMSSNCVLVKRRQAFQQGEGNVSDVPSKLPVASA